MKFNKKFWIIFGATLAVVLFVLLIYLFGGVFWGTLNSPDGKVELQQSRAQKEEGLPCGQWRCRPSDVKCTTFPNASGGTSYACVQPDGVERVVGSIGTGQVKKDSDDVSTDGLPGIDLTIENVFEIIVRLTCWLWSVSIFIIIIFIILAGIRFMNAREKPEAFTGAKKNFINVIIGALVIMGVFVIIATVANAVGVDLSLIPFNCSDQQGGDGGSLDEPDDATPPGDEGDAGDPGDGGDKVDICDDQQALAKDHNAPYPARNAPELDKLIDCIKNSDSLRGQDLGSVFTYDVSHPTCNYTRGEAICDTQCSHVRNSCHYGGRSGSEGALAVDFGNEKLSAKIIGAARACGAKNARCEGTSGGAVSCSSPNAINVSVTAAGCDAN